MYSIDENNTIKLTRGDTMPFTIDIVDEETGEPFELGEKDVVEFTLKKKITDKEPIFQLHGTSVMIEHEDTKDLPFGNYYYDVQITFEDNRKYTVIAPEEGLNQPQPNFILTAEVNWE